MEKTEEKLDKSRWLILAVVVIMPFMSTLDSSIVNVALPAISKALHIEMASVEWVVTSYLIIISSTILVFGRLGDIKGKTRIFNWGIAIFGIGSLLCGISYNIEFLVISRVVQAIGAAAAMANSQGIITHTFPQKERGKALGISGTAVALGTMVGPPLGGFIVEIVSWQYIFLINLPISIIAAVIALKVLPRDANKDESIDFKGAILFGISIVLLFFSISRGQQVGYGNLFILIAFVIAAVFLTLFILLEKGLKYPLLDLSIFKNSLFSISILCAFFSFLAIGSTNIIQPFYLQNVLKLNPGYAGFVMMIYPIVLSVVAPVSGHLSDRIGSELLTFGGLICTAIGLVLMSTLKENSSIAIMAVFIAIMSLGNGLFQSPNNSLVMSTVSRDKLGIAGSVNALVRNLGMVTGVSLSTALLYQMMSFKIGRKVSGYVPGRDDVFVYGMKYVYLFAAAVCCIGAILTAVRLRKRKDTYNI